MSERTILHGERTEARKANFKRKAIAYQKLAEAAHHYMQAHYDMYNIEHVDAAVIVHWQDISAKLYAEARRYLGLLLLENEH